MKIHRRIQGPDFRNHGQTEFEYSHTAACGYVRDIVISKDSEVTCKLCKREIAKA